MDATSLIVLYLFLFFPLHQYPTDNGTSTVSIEEIDDEAPPEAAAQEEKEVLSSTPPTSPGSDSSWVHVDNEEEKQNLEEEDEDDEDDEDDTPVRIVVRSVRHGTVHHFTLLMFLDVALFLSSLQADIPNEVVPQKVRATRSKKRLKLYEQIPKTSYEFVRVWRSIAADEKVLYINKIGSCKSISKYW